MFPLYLIFKKKIYFKENPSQNSNKGHRKWPLLGPHGELGEQHKGEVAGKLAEMSLVPSWQLQEEDVSQGLTEKRAGISLAVIAGEVAGVLQSLHME